MGGSRGAEEPADRRKARGAHRQDRRGNLAEVVWLNRFGGRAGCGEPVPGKPGHIEHGRGPRRPRLLARKRRPLCRANSTVAPATNAKPSLCEATAAISSRQARRSPRRGKRCRHTRAASPKATGSRITLPYGVAVTSHAEPRKRSTTSGGQGGPWPGPGARERIEEQPAGPHEQRLDDPEGQVGVGSEDAEQPLVEQDVEDDQVAAAPSQKRCERVVVGVGEEKPAPLVRVEGLSPGLPEVQQRRRSGRTPAGSRGAVPQSDSACGRGTSRLWSAPRAGARPSPRAPAQRRDP